MEIIQPKSFKPKIRGRKLGSGVNFQGALKQTVVKQTDVNQGLVMYNINVEIPYYKHNYESFLQEYSCLPCIKLSKRLIGQNFRKSNTQIMRLQLDDVILKKLEMIRITLLNLPQM